MPSLDHLITTGKEIYTGYLLLDMVNNLSYATTNSNFSINGQKQTFKSYIVSLIQSGKTCADFQMGSCACRVELINQAPNQWQVNLINLTQQTLLKIASDLFMNKPPVI